MLRESAIEKQACKAATLLGWWGIKLVPQFISGLPDRMFIGHHKVVFVEFKTEKGKVSKIQAYIHKKFKKYGHTVYIARSKDEMIRILNEQK